MSFTFKYAQHTEKEARFAELADGIRELVEANMNWKNNPRELLKKVAEKIKSAESDSLLTFGETEIKFAFFLQEEFKRATIAPVSKNPAALKIIDRKLENVIDNERQILIDIGTIAKS